MEYIDLGLPSGTLWASENEINTDGTQYFTYEEAMEKFGDSMPTKEDFEELITNCWTYFNDTQKRMEFIGNNGAKIFLPALGYRSGSNVYSMQDDGDYWSSTPNDSDYAHYLYFYSNDVDLDECYRDYGQAVRLVKRAQQGKEE